MKNKILIKVYVPYIDENFEIYIPTNESIKKITDLIVKSIYDLSEENLDIKLDYRLLDPIISKAYIPANIVRETNIVNNKKIILI